jgi:hypothetical protein
MDGTTRAGRYEVRRETRLGVPMANIVWVPEDGSPAIPVTTMAPDRLPLLAEALNEYLAADPAAPTTDAG